jgi:hypothetical protein
MGLPGLEPRWVTQAKVARAQDGVERAVDVDCMAK